MKLEQVKYCELRSVWKNESSDFTNWLAKPINIKKLGERVGFEMELVKKEATKNSRFRVDILAKEKESGEFVIIENQLEETNHSHLGQIITYASLFDSNKIIWIVKDIRPEFELAINWLNNKTKAGVQIYLVRIQLIKIGNSRPAPLFTLISKPYSSAYPKIKLEFEDMLQIKLQTKEEIEVKLLDKGVLKFFDANILPGNKYLKKGIYNEELGLIDKLHKHDKRIGLKYDLAPAQNFLKDLKIWAEFRQFTINEAHMKRTGRFRIRRNGFEYYVIEMNIVNSE